MKTDLDIELLRAESRKARSLKEADLKRKKRNEQKARNRFEQEAKEQGEVLAKEQLPDLIEEVKNAAKKGEFSYTLVITRLNNGVRGYINKSSQKYLRAKAQAEAVQKYFTGKRIRAELDIVEWSHTEGIFDSTWREYVTSFRLLLSWD